MYEKKANVCLSYREVCVKNHEDYAIRTLFIITYDFYGER